MEDAKNISSSDYHELVRKDLRNQATRQERKFLRSNLGRWLNELYKIEQDVAFLLKDEESHIAESDPDEEQLRRYRIWRRKSINLRKAAIARIREAEYQKEVNEAIENANAAKVTAEQELATAHEIIFILGTELATLKKLKPAQIVQRYAQKLGGGTYQAVLQKAIHQPKGKMQLWS